MTPLTLCAILFAAGIVLIALELFLPTHGILGIIGVLAVLGGIGVCFWFNQWVGLAVLLATMAASPFVANWSFRIWRRTPVGRKIILAPVDSVVMRSPVAIGQTGKAVSELRPMGVIEIDGNRVEARSEIGVISAGSTVHVVSFDNNRPCVRAV